MKKRLEAELMSIAHRVLKLKGKEDLTLLYAETQKLYEALSVLKFVEDNINVVLPKIDVAAVEQKLIEKLDNTELDKLDSEYLSKLESEMDELRADLNEIEGKIEKSSIPKTVFFEDLISNDYKVPVFEKVESPLVKSEQDRIIDFELNTHQDEQPELIDEELKTEDKNEISEEKSNTITISLNDRIGFVKNLFDDNNEDYIRVLSQLSTFDDANEAKDFIENMVKPDYNNWEGKEDFEARFMEVVEKNLLKL